MLCRRPKIACSCGSPCGSRCGSIGGGGTRPAALLALFCCCLGGVGVAGLEMETLKGCGCVLVTLKAGDHIKADPRCIVSRGTGLALRPKDKPDEGRLLQGLKRKLLKKIGQEQHQNQLQTLSNTMSSNATDCLLAPPFPGDIALVSVERGTDANPPDTGKRPRTNTGRIAGRAATDSRSRRSRAPSTGRRKEQPEPRGRGTEPRTFVLLTQALVAVGPEVTVTPMPAGGQTPSGLLAKKSGRSNTGALSLCEGQGPIAVAGYGRLKKLRLRAGQRRIVDSTRAVGWTSSVTRLSSWGRASGSSAENPSAVTSFVGPGVVYLQTHSLAGLRRLLLPKAGFYPQGAVSGFRGAGRAGRGAGASRGAEVGLSLKRGLAKRAKAGAKRVILALAFFALYVLVYSLATALLLEGREGLGNAPRHALQVVRSLSKVARRVVMVLLRLGQEELWGKEGDDQGGMQAGLSLSADGPDGR